MGAILMRMATIQFDTLKFARRLKSAGVPDAQAEAQADALAELFASGTDQLATKADLNAVEVKLTGDIKLLRWMMGLLLAGVGSLVLKAFFIA